MSRNYKVESEADKKWLLTILTLSYIPQVGTYIDGLGVIKRHGASIPYGVTSPYGAVFSSSAIVPSSMEPELEQDCQELWGDDRCNTHGRDTTRTMRLSTGQRCFCGHSLQA